MSKDAIGKFEGGTMPTGPLKEGPNLNKKDKIIQAAAAGATGVLGVGLTALTIDAVNKSTPPPEQNTQPLPHAQEVKSDETKNNPPEGVTFPDKLMQKLGLRANTPSTQTAQKLPYGVELPAMMKGATKAPEIKEGMYGTWQKEIKMSQNGYQFGLENGEKAGLVVRNWQPLLHLTEYYGNLHGYKSITVNFKDESELAQEMRDKMRKVPLTYKDDLSSDQVLFYRSNERQPGTPPYGRYGNFPVYGEHRESFVDASGSLHLRFNIILLNRDKYEKRVENFDPRDVLPRRVTEVILLTILTGAKTNEEYSRLVSEYILGREPFPRIKAWYDEYSAPDILHDEYLFRVKL